MTLATYSIDKRDMPRDQHGKFPYATIPSLLIGQLAAHREYEGNGLGRTMVGFAKEQAHALSQNVGCRLIALQPLPGALPWYERNTTFKLLERRGKKDIMYYNLGERNPR